MHIGESKAQVKKEWTSTLKGTALTVFTTVATIGTVLAYYPITKEAVRDIDSALRYFSYAIATKKLAINPMGSIATGTYVERPELEKKLADFLKEPRLAGRYFVLFGPKGAGKSTVVQKVLQDRKGVILLSASNVSTKDSIIDSLSHAVIGYAGVIKNPNDFFMPLATSTVPPVIVFEVDRGGSDDYTKGIEAVRSLAKMYAPACHCIVVLSEAGAVLQFNKDKTRAIFECVDDLTVPQAKTMLKNMLRKVNLPEIDDAKMEYIFSAVGANPQLLSELVADLKFGKFKSVEEYVERKLKDARIALENYPHQAILKALKEHPEGVPPTYFWGQTSGGIELNKPIAVVARDETNIQENIILYRMDLPEKVYQLQSQAYRTALQDYEPTVSRNENPIRAAF